MITRDEALALLEQGEPTMLLTNREDRNESVWEADECNRCLKPEGGFAGLCYTCFKQLP